MGKKTSFGPKTQVSSPMDPVFGPLEHVLEPLKHVLRPVESVLGFSEPILALQDLQPMSAAPKKPRDCKENGITEPLAVNLKVMMSD